MKPSLAIDEGMLDSELIEHLCAALAADPVDPTLASRVKRRVLRAIAAEESSHRTVQPTDGRWQPFGDGVQIKVLNREGGLMSYLLKLAPGATIEPHRHPHDEECVVLEGTLMIGGSLALCAGGFHLARRGALHDTLSTVGGATIFLRGAVPELAHLI